MERNKTGFVNILRDLTTETAKNILMGIPAVRKKRLTRPRTTASHMDTDEFLKNYAFSSLNLLLEHTGDLRGKSVCEIGAGDFLTSGLSILAAGAPNYAVIDRFPGDYFGDEAKYWYQKIEENWARFYPATVWDKTLDGKNFPENNHDRLELISEPIETAQTNQKFDIVCSFQVGEHISDIDAFAEIHQRLLKPNGVGLHRIDYGPHGCWFSYRDPTTFLRFSDFVWKQTGSNRGTPNRRRHHEFMSAFERAGLNAEITLLEHFDEKTINFERLDKKFRGMPRDSMLVGTGIYLLTKK